MTCCAPSAGPRDAAASEVEIKPATLDVSERVGLSGGKFTMGTDDRILPQDGEYPARSARVKPFAIDACAVTNARFARFIEDTGYITEAQRFGWSYVFYNLLKSPSAHEPLPGLEWWRKVDGATWDAPEGPGSDVSDRPDHPVVQVSWNDAVAFADWAGGRLPTEAEWEFAAQGGLAAPKFPWGDREPDDADHQPCNIWQGAFPRQNSMADGYLATAPARSFAPNGYGLFNMVGNTWEWSADRFRVRSLSKAAKALNATAHQSGARVIKGGSYLCHISYCYRYRIAARTSNTPDTTLSHTGFRVAYAPDRATRAA